MSVVGFVIVEELQLDCAHEIIDYFNGLSVMSVYFRFLVDDNLVDE